jgi:hypothetical protein
MLAYFHYCTPGYLPFKKNWTSPGDIETCQLNNEQVIFLQQTSRELHSKCDYCLTIRSDINLILFIS